MSNIFRSKEVFKKIPGVSADQNPLRRVRNMCVSGEASTPLYVDGKIQIKSMGSNKATLIDYFQKSNAFKEPILNLVNVSDNTITITSYTKTNKSNESQILNLLNVTDTVLNVVSWSTNKIDLTTDNVLNLLSVSDNTLSVQIYTSLNKTSTPEPIIKIKSINTIKATISNL